MKPPVSETNYYIDTTVAIDGILGPPEARDFIRSTIEGHACACSFVWIEYNRTLIADCGILFNAAVKAPTIGDFTSNIDNHWFLKWHPKRKKRCCELRDSVLRDCERRDGSISIQEVRSQLRFYALRLLPHRLSCLCRKQNPDNRDSFSCPLEEPPHILDNGTIYVKINCSKKSKPSCCLPEIYKSQFVVIDHILSIMDSHNANIALDDDQLKMLDVLRSIRGGQQINFPRGQKACFPLGDLTIAICCPEGLPILTTNVGHFAPLAACIDRVLLKFRLSPPGVEAVDLSAWQK